MTPWELERMIAAKQRQHKAQLRTQAVIAYQQAGVTAALMSRVWGNKQKAPDLKTAFPGIFEDVPAPSEPGSKPYKQQDYRIMKARLEQYAARKKWGEKKRGNHHRGASDSDNSQNGRATEGSGVR